MRSGEYFEYENWTKEIENHSQVILRIPSPMKLKIQNALLTSFLNGFCRNITCWKGLELRNLDTLQLVRPYIQGITKYRISKPLLKFMHHWKER